MGARFTREGGVIVNQDNQFIIYAPTFEEERYTIVQGYRIPIADADEFVHAHNYTYHVDLSQLAPDLQEYQIDSILRAISDQLGQSSIDINIGPRNPTDLRDFTIKRDFEDRVRFAGSATDGNFIQIAAPGVEHSGPHIQDTIGRQSNFKVRFHSSTPLGTKIIAANFDTLKAQMIDTREALVPHIEIEETEICRIFIESGTDKASRHGVGTNVSELLFGSKWLNLATGTINTAAAYEEIWHHAFDIYRKIESPQTGFNYAIGATLAIHELSIDATDADQVAFFNNIRSLPNHGVHFDNTLLAWGIPNNGNEMIVNGHYIISEGTEPTLLQLAHDFLGDEAYPLSPKHVKLLDLLSALDLSLPEIYEYSLRAFQPDIIDIVDGVKERLNKIHGATIINSTADIVGHITTSVDRNRSLMYLEREGYNVELLREIITDYTWLMIGHHLNILNTDMDQRYQQLNWDKAYKKFGAQYQGQINAIETESAHLHELPYTPKVAQRMCELRFQRAMITNHIGQEAFKRSDLALVNRYHEFIVFMRELRLQTIASEVRFAYNTCIPESGLGFKASLPSANETIEAIFPTALTYLRHVLGDIQDGRYSIDEAIKALKQNK